MALNSDRKSYVIGGALSVALTLLAFGVVAMGLPRRSAMLVVGLAAIAQLVVQLRYFLHLRTSGQEREDLQVLLFSALLLIIMVAGSIWVLGDLARRMM